MIRTADTQYGTVKGLPADDPRVTVFRGIPYAAPPTGQNRWRAPKPCERWDGVRLCYEFGPISMQDRPGVCNDIYCREFHVDPDIPISEDCLYLNVWTGAKDTSEKLPVLVWIYGGAYQWGYTAEMEFNGERLARHGVIVVSMGYRLGAFGFLAHPSLTAEDPGHPSNFGLLDIRSALMWTFDNIAAFGGDPDNITIAGQSAGGNAASLLLSDEQNAGMIKRAAIFSGFIHDPFLNYDVINSRDISVSQKNGEEFIKALGCHSIDEARQVDAITVRDVYAGFAKDHPRFAPCIDGIYVKKDPYHLMLEGKMPDVPVMTGYTRDEFPENIPPNTDAQSAGILAGIKERNGNRVFNVVEQSVRTVASAHVRNNRKAPLYTYRFEPEIPGYDRPGDFHSCDLWFFFETIQKCWRPYSGRHYELARRMCDYWTNFIKTGDPNGEGYDGQTLPIWKSVSSEDVAKDEMIFS